MTRQETQFQHRDPAWWKSDYDSAWERTKVAFRRDWEQTKRDLGSKTARDLGQDAGDTVKQATGSQPIPYMTPGAYHNRTSNFDEVERASRFGYGARRHYGDRYGGWSAELERELRMEWGDDDWERDRDEVRRGWEYEDPTQR